MYRYSGTPGQSPEWPRIQMTGRQSFCPVMHSETAGALPRRLTGHKIDGKVVERPQHMLMRVAVGIHGEDIDAAIETYNMMSEKLFTHASPTMFNAATPRPQLSSCFLLTMSGDSIEGIYDTLKQCALISKSAGGIGLNVHCIRATGSYIGKICLLITMF